MGQFIKVATRGEFENVAGGKLVQAGGESIAIFKVGNSYHAIANTCTHRGGPLSEGMLSGEVVTCPWHGGRFDVKTGRVMGPPPSQNVKSYPVRVTGENIEIEIG